MANSTPIISQGNLATLQRQSQLDDKIDPFSWKVENTDGGQRRILTCDGGGMRGLISAVMLDKMEKDLQKFYQDPDYRLGHYFDLVGGTSTGSIVASWVALGMKMESLIEIYRSSEGAAMFTPSAQGKIPLIGGLFTKYTSENLEEVIEKYIQDTKMNSEDPKFLCDLIICAKNATTGEPTFFNSNPLSAHFGKTKDLFLRDLIRCSSAAPTYFPPKCMVIDGKDYEFIDGGIGYNNPTFPVFIDAVHPDHGFAFAAQEDKLLVVNVGTGYANTEVKYGEVGTFKALNWAQYLITRLMEDSSIAQVSLMKLIGYCPNQNEEGSPIWEAALPDFSSSNGHGKDGVKNFCTYYRYGTELTVERIKILLDKLGSDMFKTMTDPLGGPEDAIEALKKMDRTDDPYRNLLVAVGEGILAERYLPGQLIAFTSKTSKRPRSVEGLKALDR